MSGPNILPKMKEIPDFLRKNRQDLLLYIRQSIIGDFSYIPTAFGLRPQIYADYVASGRSLSFIEDYITEQVLPYYANTHTFTSWVGVYTGNLRSQSRSIIKSCINASEKDALIFVGSGATGAIQKLIEILKGSNWGSYANFYVDTGKGTAGCSYCGEKFQSENAYIKHSEVVDHNCKKVIDLNPIVFVSVFEHHSNLLPWKEAGAEIIMIDDDKTGVLDLKMLENQLELHKSRPLKIGSFSACSNVNGIITDVKAVTRLLKIYNALAFFDYAASAPYVVIDMNPSEDAEIDGIFFSGHKFIGGPGCPGVLAVKRKIIGNAVPSGPGGGTVYYVSRNDHGYLANPEEKEEGGTPDIIGSIKLGLVFLLKAAIGDHYIYSLEITHFKKISKRLVKIPNLTLYGSIHVERLPIFSFMIKHKNKHFHYGFIAALLNDLFGIQTRGSCNCAGPYAIKLLESMKMHSMSLLMQAEKG